MSLVSKRDQVAVVTGASGGIGRAIALELAQAGAAVGVHGNVRREECQHRLSGKSWRWRRLGSKVSFADLKNPRGAAEAFARCGLALAIGRLTFWVNLAGADVLTGEAAELAV